MRTIQVKPIYGWGWVIAGSPRFEVPEPFTLRLEENDSRRWTGVVVDDGHEFQGCRVTLSQRHVEWTGAVNVLVEAAGAADKPSSGFGMLDARPGAA